MRIDKMVNKRTRPEQTAKNHNELMQRKRHPKTKEGKDFEAMYNPNRKKRNPCE